MIRPATRQKTGDPWLVRPVAKAANGKSVLVDERIKGLAGLRVVKAWWRAVASLLRAALLEQSAIMV